MRQTHQAAASQGEQFPALTTIRSDLGDMIAVILELECVYEVI